MPSFVKQRVLIFKTRILHTFYHLCGFNADRRSINDLVQRYHTPYFLLYWTFDLSWLSHMCSGLQAGFSLRFDWGCRIGERVVEGGVSCCSAGSRGTVPRAENGKLLREEINLLTID